MKCYVCNQLLDEDRSFINDYTNKGVHRYVCLDCKVYAYYDADYNPNLIVIKIIPNYEINLDLRHDETRVNVTSPKFEQIRKFDFIVDFKMDRTLIAQKLKTILTFL